MPTKRPPAPDLKELAPMLLVQQRVLPRGSDWSYELKYKYVPPPVAFSQPPPTRLDRCL